MGKVSRIMICALTVFILGVLVFPEKGFAYDESKNEIVKMDANPFLDQSLQIILKNGVIISPYLVEKDGDLYKNPYWAQDYTNILNFDELPSSTFKDYQKKIAFKFNTNGKEPIWEFHNGTKEDPFDFSNIDLADGNIISSRQVNHEDKGTFLKVKLIAGEKYFLEGQINDFQIVDSSGLSLYENRSFFGEIFGGHRGNGLIGVILEPTKTDTYLFENRRDSIYSGHTLLSIDLTQIDANKDIPVSMGKPYQARTKAYSFDTRKVDVGSIQTTITNTKKYNGIEPAFAYLRPWVYTKGTTDYYPFFTQDPYDFNHDYSNTPYMSHSTINKDTIYLNGDNISLIYKMDIARSVSLNEDITLSLDAKLYTPKIGIVAKEEVKELKAEDREMSMVSDPVDSFRGNFVDNRTLMSYSGANALDFTIGYDSIANDSESLESGYVHNYETWLKENGETLTVFWTPNAKTVFTKKQDGSFIANRESQKELVLEKNNNHYILKDSNTTYTFDLLGKLIQKKDKNGHEVFYKYENNLLVEVSNTRKQHYFFEYNKNGKLSKVKDNAKREITFSYSTSYGYLEIIKLVNGAKLNIGYQNLGDSENPDYKVSSLNLNNNNRIVNNVYNKVGAISEQRDGGYNNTNFYYDETTDENSITTTIEEPDGHSYTKTHNLSGQVIRETNKRGFEKTYKYNEKGQKTEETDFKGNVTEFEYNENNYVTKALNPDGTTIEYIYDSKDNLIELVSADDVSSFFEYDNSGRLVKTIDKLGLETIFNYDPLGNIITQQQGSRITETTYDAVGNISSIKTPNGKTVRYKYDELGRQIEVKMKNGQALSTEYDTDNNVIKTTGLEGEVNSYQYDVFGKLLKETDVSGRVTSYAYDALGNISERKTGTRGLDYRYDEMGRLSSYKKIGDYYIYNYRYDADGNIIEEIDEEGIRTVNSYDENGNLESVKTGESIIQYEYDSMDRLVGVIDGEENKTKYENDENGWVSKEISPKGYETNYRYDSMGRLIETIDSKGSKYETKYDKYGNKVKTIDPLGQVTSYAYSENNQLLSIVNALSEKTTYVYNDLEQLSEIRNNYDEVIQSYLYYPSGNVSESIDGNGNSKRFVYDILGRIIETYDGKGNLVVKNEYNRFDELIQTVDGLNQMNTFTYDYRGNLTRQVNPLKTKTTYKYEANGLLNSSTDAYGSVSRHTYDSTGRVSETLMTNGFSVGYEYNKNHKMILETLPTGATLNYLYDEEQQLTERKNARGSSIYYEYDENGNVIKETTPEGITTYSYDALNQLLQTNSPTGTILRQYDALGRVIEKTQNGKTIKYQYDKRGHLVQMMYPDGQLVSYTYDIMGNLLSVTDWNNKVTAYEYNENNQLVKTIHSNGIEETREYDIIGQMTVLKSFKGDNVITHFTYEYDGTGNISKETDVLNQTDDLYAYDLLGRLITANQNSYTYTKNGNMSAYNITVNGESISQKMTYGYDNELKKVGNELTEMDRDGNLLTYKLNGKTYISTYNSKNQLTKYGSTSYQYDDEGNRIRVVEESEDGTPSVETIFVVDNDSSRYSQVLVEETNDAETLYVYGHGLISEYKEEKQQTYHYDYRGSTIAMSDADGLIIGQANYDEYGVVLNSSLHTRFMYNGQYGVETDVKGLYYMRTRYYNVDLKRFMNRDVVAGTVQESQSLNRFAFVNGNPVNFTDPFGMARELLENTKAEATSSGSDLNELHALLDVVGMFPLLGEAADIANSLIYLSEGDYKNATLSAIGAIPGVGMVATGGKWMGKAVGHLDSALDGVKRSWNWAKKDLKSKLGNQGGYIQPSAFIPKKKSVDKIAKLLDKYSEMGIPPLKNKELLVGDYRAIKSPPIAEVGDRLTGHHMPSNAFIAQFGIKSDDGIVLNLEQTRHIATHTYGRSPKDLKDYMNLSPRDALAMDIKDTKAILMESKFDRKMVNDAMREVVRKSTTNHPTVFGK